MDAALTKELETIRNRERIYHRRRRRIHLVSDDELPITTNETSRISFPGAKFFERPLLALEHVLRSSADGQWDGVRKHITGRELFGRTFDNMAFAGARSFESPLVQIALP